MRPKAQGTLNLQQVVAEEEKNGALDFFVMFSSVSSVVGNFGQSSYASANAYHLFIYIIITIIYTI